MGEFRIAASQPYGSGGSAENGPSEAVSGSGAFAMNDAIALTGGENGLPVGGTGGTISPREILCTAKDNFNEFDVNLCDYESTPRKTVLRLEREWKPAGEHSDVWGPPLVANLTDDEGDDGDVDLCDYPDIVIVAVPPLFCIPFTDCATVPIPIIRLIDGRGGTLHESLFEWPVFPGTTPAIGDIDRDGSPDVIAASRTNMTSEVDEPSVVAFERDGRVKWVQATNESPSLEVETIAITLADLDNEGEVEVIAGFDIFDGRNGKPIITEQEIINTFFSEVFNILISLDLYDDFRVVLRVAPIAADLDDDGDLEVVIGPIAFHHDGHVYYYDQTNFILGIFSYPILLPLIESLPYFESLTDLIAEEEPIYSIYPLVANLDDDSEPEVLFTAGSAVYILENDGRVKRILDLYSLGVREIGPVTVHDFNGDKKPEIAFDTSKGLFVYDRNLEQRLFDHLVDGEPGCVTSFDFQGDGAAEIIYSDGNQIRLIDIQNPSEMPSYQREGSKGCAVVADVDNDKDAEIVIVNEKTALGSAPSVQVLGEKNNYWVPTRRIWNEYNYHVTNVLEDSTIPVSQSPYLERLNTFRANVHFCVPIVK